MHNGFCWVFLKRIEFIPFVVAAFWNFHNFYVAFRLDVGRGHIFHFLCCWCFMLFAFAAHFRHFIDDNRTNKLETQTTIEIRNDKRRHSASKTAETKKKTTARAMNMFCCVIFGVWSFDIYSRCQRVAGIVFFCLCLKWISGKRRRILKKKYLIPCDYWSESGFFFHVGLSAILYVLRSIRFISLCHLFSLIWWFSLYTTYICIRARKASILHCVYIYHWKTIQIKVNIDLEDRSHQAKGRIFPSKCVGRNFFYCCCMCVWVCWPHHPHSSHNFPQQK